MNETLPVCKVCEKGNLVKIKKYRLSGPAVVIGYIILIPSICGMLLGLFILLGAGLLGGAAATTTPDTVRPTITAELQKVNVPDDIIEKVINNQNIDEDRKKLTPKQLMAIDTMKISLTATKVGAGAGAVVAGGFAIFFIVASFVSGLVGWLLVMKKKVLQCSACSAVVNAS